VRLIVDREKEIEAFNPEEYWNIDALLSGASGAKKFTARLHSHIGEGGAEKLTVTNQEQSDKILSELEGKDYIVSALTSGQRKKVPAPPFITSTLQQEASRRLGFTATRTMRAAQTLYEGVDIAGIGTTGLITYMRTDSLRVSDEAVTAAKEYITGEWGTKYVNKTKRTYKSKNATAAQDAHEAVRPSNPALTPTEVEKSISGDTAKLYRLIWSRFIASQMTDALHNTMSVEVTAGDYLFKASGYTVAFDGYTALYEEATDEKEKKETALPPLEENTTLRLRDLTAEQKFTQPPSRYTEATLIKSMEENGIGRPSTYAPIITTVIDRGYVERDAKKLVPTVLGRTINELMMNQFSAIVDVHFSAQMEKNLDKVEAGKADWVATVDEFYQKFDKTLQQAEEDLKDVKIKVPDEETDEICELCGRNMVIKTGRYGKFLACPGFPDCKNTKRIVKAAEGECPLCGGRILVRHSKKGRIYYGCEQNPTCGFMTWDEPSAEKCPNCGKTLFKKGGKSGNLVCITEGCGYNTPIAK
ncbi:MAG: type I DNA topoisomerase, partial [Pygmaiobacter sp.]